MYFISKLSIIEITSLQTVDNPVILLRLAEGSGTISSKRHSVLFLTYVASDKGGSIRGVKSPKPIVVKEMRMKYVESNKGHPENKSFEIIFMSLKVGYV